MKKLPAFCTINGFLISRVLFAQTLSYTVVTGGLQSIPLEGGMSEIEFADINGDGNVDLLSIGDHGAAIGPEFGVMVWFGDGTGNNWNLFQNGNFGYGGIA